MNHEERRAACSHKNINWNEGQPCGYCRACNSSACEIEIANLKANEAKLREALADMLILARKPNGFWTHKDMGKEQNAKRVLDETSKEGGE